MTVLSFDAQSAGQVPADLVEYMTPGAWAAFHADVTKAKKDGCCKACFLEFACCICFGCVCVFCFHPCIQTSMASSKLDGCCRRANTKHFNSLTVLSMSNDSLTINTGAAAGLPKIQPQGVMSQGQMQQYGGNPQYVQGQPQYVQGQPQYVQGQPQYVQGQPQYVQGQPQYVQGQPQYVQGQPQYVQQGQLPNPSQSVPPSYAEPLPPYTENQPPIAQPITYPDTNPKYVEEDAPKYVEEDAPPLPSPGQRQGQYVVSDPGVLGTTVTVKTSDLQVVNIPVPADCPIGAVLSYMY